MANSFSTQSISQSVSVQLQSQQAQRNAEQARTNAEALQKQADAAQSAADRAQDDARTLRVEANHAEGESNRLEQGLRAQQSFTDMRSRQQATHTQVTQPKPPQPTVNLQGQVTGQVISTTA